MTKVKRQTRIDTDSSRWVTLIDLLEMNKASKKLIAEMRNEN